MKGCTTARKLLGPWISCCQDSSVGLRFQETEQHLFFSQRCRRLEDKGSWILMVVSQGKE